MVFTAGVFPIQHHTRTIPLSNKYLCNMSSMPYYFIHSSPNTLLMEVLLQTCFSDREMVTQERLNTSLQGTDLVLGSARLSVHPGRVALLPASQHPAMLFPVSSLSLSREESLPLRKYFKMLCCLSFSKVISLGRQNGLAAIESMRVASVVSDSLWAMDCSPLGSSVHRILQARILEWVAIPVTRGPSQPKNWTWV